MELQTGKVTSAKIYIFNLKLSTEDYPAYSSDGAIISLPLEKRTQHLLSKIDHGKLVAKSFLKAARNSLILILTSWSSNSRGDLKSYLQVDTIDKRAASYRTCMVVHDGFQIPNS